MGSESIQYNANTIGKIFFPTDQFTLIGIHHVDILVKIF